MKTKTALKLFSCALFVMVGCDAVAPVEEKTERSSSLANDSRTLTSVTKKTAPVPAAIDILPPNGALFDGERTDGLSVQFSGFTTAAGETVEVQVLSSADALIAEGNWVTIATTTSSTTGTTFNDAAKIFRWDVQAVPSEGADWLQGGLLRYRTVSVQAGKKTLLPFYDTSAGDCIAAKGATKSWKDLIKACKSPFSPDLGAALGSTTKAATLVSPTPKPGDDFVPNYLSRKGFIDVQDTQDYYDSIGAPVTLDEFKDRFGFFDNDDAAAALYYNLGDLGIGREMYCRKFESEGGGTACYVANYGVDANGQPAFSGDPDNAMEDAVQGLNSFATVAMVKFGDKFGDPEGNDVQFFVYNASDELVNEAQLDTFGTNLSIPNNCTNCHGGQYSRNTGKLIGASFLPFDPEGFLFSREKRFSYAAQEDQIRALNVLTKEAGSTPGTSQFVDGIYGGKADVAGTKANLEWMPAGWAVSEEAKTVYREIYKPYCRTCHTSQVGDFAFMTYEDFKNEASKTMNSACITNEMPVAEATMNLFWRSSARAYLVNSLDVASACTAGGESR